MKKFLEFVAEDIINKHGTDLSRIAVVFPNKRASLFLNEHLAKLAGRPIWSPAYITISDLFRRHSQLSIGDPIKLTCEMHKSFTECTGVDETLDHFFGWGQLLLADFDDIDKNMADASKVFANVKDLHELDDISYLDEEQVEALKRFFSNFTNAENTELKKRFMQLWCHLEDIYNNFRQRLKNQGIAYEGMMYREVAADESIDFNYDTYLFVGFNVVQKVEQQVFARLQKAGKARFYWDFDRYYMPDGNPTAQQNEAGHYISAYLKSFPNELDVSDAKIYDNFKSGKSITYINATTENIQARYVANWLKEHERYKDGKNTAIVMCDESLLPTVIHCIPDEAESINITTGYPLFQTAVASFVLQLIDMQANGYSPAKGTFRVSYVMQVLNHPYAQYVSEACPALAAKLKKEHTYNPSPAALAADENTAVLFMALGGKDELTQWLLDVLRLVAERCDKAPLAQESLFRMYTLCNRLNELTAAGDLDVDLTTMQKLVIQLVNATSIPFHGEPAEGVQVMGILETRNLDFDHVLILSCNEGNMPKGVNDSSFIPYSIRKAYGLTTVDNKVAVYAYYFYNLIQRAADVTIAYNSSTDGSSTGESRRVQASPPAAARPRICLIDMMILLNLLALPDGEGAAAQGAAGGVERGIIAVLTVLARLVRRGRAGGHLDVGLGHALHDAGIGQHELPRPQHKAVSGPHQTGVDEGGVLVHIVGPHDQGGPLLAHRDAHIVEESKVIPAPGDGDLARQTVLPDRETALEITAAFREIFPEDPVKADFVLTRFGIHPDFGRDPLEKC